MTEMLSFQYKVKAYADTHSMQRFLYGITQKQKRVRRFRSGWWNGLNTRGDQNSLHQEQGSFRTGETGSP